MPKKISTLKKLGSAKVISKKNASWVRPTTKKVFSINRGFAFSARANRLIKLRPTIPKEVFRAFLRSKLRGEEVASNGAVVLKRINPRAGVGNHFFKMNVGKHFFFVKVVEKKKLRYPFLPDVDLALSQYNSLIEAKKTLNKLPPNLKNRFDVVTPQFSFVSRNYSFLVTDFIKFDTVYDILKKKSSTPIEAVPFNVFDEGVKFFKSQDFLDVGKHNTFFSPIDNKFILFDLRKRI